MSSRSLHIVQSFYKELAAIAKKHRDLEETVNEALEYYREEGPKQTDHQIRGMDGIPVYKTRLPIGNLGKRRGARLIFICDDTQVIALSIYTKSVQKDISDAELLSRISQILR